MRRIAGFTALEWIILIVIAGLLFAVAGHMIGDGKPSGLVYAALGETGSLIEVDDVAGYQAAANPGALDSASFTVRLFLGNMGGADMDRATVTFSDRSGATVLPQGAEGDAPPYWMIADRLNRPPFRTADGDNLLEPGESFVIRVLFPHPVGAGETFTIALTPPVGLQESIQRTVPPRVTPVTVL
ncbi:hypothetical protein [Methanofollis tationis]|uniref:Flagellin n=1 Tax=Methanofollis tationis TaxID=81417 RepID=A0A7K4HRJ9_9EURY|nr:hypothetical protein [Methanofollis tationis]NVO67468.1 hypothetical protein [Methanofollis tationis]